METRSSSRNGYYWRSLWGHGP